jgi:hypothetical protein
MPLRIRLHSFTDLERLPRHEAMPCSHAGRSAAGDFIVDVYAVAAETCPEDLPPAGMTEDWWTRSLALSQIVGSAVRAGVSPVLRLGSYAKPRPTTMDRLHFTAGRQLTMASEHFGLARAGKATERAAR